VNLSGSKKTLFVIGEKVKKPAKHKNVNRRWAQMNADDEVQARQGQRVGWAESPKCDSLG
jgi:hypothetical protein